MKTSTKSDPLDTWIIWVGQVGEVVGVTLDRDPAAWGGCEDGGWYPQAAPKLSQQVSARGAVDSPPVPLTLWVGASPLVTLLLRLTLLAYPPRPTYLTVGREWGDGTEWG